MHTLTKYLSRAVFVTAFLALFLATPALRAADAGYGQNVGMIALADKLDASDAKQVILQAIAARRFELRESTDGKIVAFHARGDNSLTLTITYNSKEISLFAVGSARGGGLPMRWIDNLKKDLNVFLIRKVATKG